ncbi:MAG: hypothetical protein AAF404_01480 [Pseudomonadota bacterium]
MIREIGQRAYTPEQWDVFAHAFGHHSDGEIARTLGVTTTAIRYQRNKRGIEPLYENPSAR